MDNDKALSPIKEYAVLSPINSDKMSSSIDKYGASLPLKKDTTLSPINNEVCINCRSAIIQSSLDNCSTEKNVIKPSSALMQPQKRNQDHQKMQGPTSAPSHYKRGVH